CGKATKVCATPLRERWAASVLTPGPPAPNCNGSRNPTPPSACACRRRPRSTPSCRNSALPPILPVPERRVRRIRGRREKKTREWQQDNGWRCVRGPMKRIAPEELGRLYREHAPALRLYVCQWPGGDEDLVQDAFIKLAQVSPEPVQVLAWLYSVVRN